MASSVYLAVDLGASSGRVMAAFVGGDKIILEELNRFPTKGYEENGSYYWDVQDIFSYVVEGLKQAQVRFGDRVAGIGVDTWGVDYGLLDASGKLIGNPYMYRDGRTEGVEARIQKTTPRKTIYKETGIQFMFFNTINQLVAEKESAKSRFGAAVDLLFMPDLFNFWLCGQKIQERSMASTSQLLNPTTGVWSEVLLDALELPKHLFKPITEPGTRIGSLLPELQEQTGLGAVPVFAVAGHDTGSAVAGAPLSETVPAFLSSGTWSLMGVELNQPIINEATLAASYSNEAGVEGTTRFLKNICGMWLVEQLKEEWSADGEDYSYDTLVQLARESTPFKFIIDPDADTFARPGPMAGRIQECCRERDQPVPQSHGELLRTVFDSLACKYRLVFDQLSELSGSPLTALRVVGGASQNDFLNQCTADALGCPVHAGPVEATSLGNVLMQLRGAGKIPSLAAGRQRVENSVETKTFLPADSAAWQPPIARLKTMVTN